MARSSQIGRDSGCRCPAGGSPSNAAADRGLSESPGSTGGGRIQAMPPASKVTRTRSGRKFESVGIPVTTQHPRRAKRRVSRERKLAVRCEYSNPRLVGVFLDDERRFRKVRLQSDGLHCRGIEVTGPAHDRQLVAGQGTLRKDVDNPAVQDRACVPRCPFQSLPPDSKARSLGNAGRM